MTVYLVPCGVSILRNLEIMRPRPVGYLDVPGALQEVAAWAHDTQGSAVASTWPDAWDWAAERLRLSDWPARVSAELSTLAARWQVDSPHIASTDRRTVILLASDTPEGMLAAHLNATYLTAETPTDVGYARTASDPVPPRPHDHPVWVVTLTGLRPFEGDGFRRAAEGVGLVMRAVADAVNTTREPVEAHLSGGFKPTLLHTMALAEMLRSILRGRADVTAWYLAEEADEGTGVGPYQVGLRSYSPMVLNVLRTELDDVLRGRIGPEAECEYEGVAWDRLPEPTLNAFGRGYRALLGGPPRGGHEGF